MAPKRDPIGRFLSRLPIVGPDDCWEWPGCRTAGYGYFSDGYTRIRPHRFAYELFVGPIPDGMVIDHLCRNRACVNPWHLEPVTDRVNVLRGVGPSARHAVKTHCPRGHEYNYVLRGGKGQPFQRRCMVCDNELRRQRKERARAA